MNPNRGQAAPLDSGREAELIADAQSGDRAAYLDLTDQYQRPLYRLIYALTRNAEEAELLAQEALVRAWRDIASYPTGQRFFPWLLRIARNLPFKTSSPSSARERGGTLLAAIDGLRREDRWALGLRVVERLSYSEIAALLDLPAGIVVLRIAQARGQILGSSGGFEEVAF